MWTGPKRIELVAAGDPPSDRNGATKCPGCTWRVEGLLYCNFWGCYVCLSFLYHRQKKMRLEDMTKRPLPGRKAPERTILEGVDGTWMSLAQLREIIALRAYWNTFEE